MNIKQRKLNKAFTLMEIIVAMAIISILFAVIVPQFSIIRSNWAGNQASAEIIQNGRVLGEHIQRYLCAAVKITSITSTAITFEDASGASYTYQLSGGYVEFGPTGSEAQLAGPVTSFQVSGFSLDDLQNAITDANSVRFMEFQTSFTNDTSAGANKAFLTDVYIQTNGQTTAQPQTVIDAFIKSGEADTAFDYGNTGDDGTNAIIKVDRKDGKSVIHALLWFKDVVGTGSEQVPANTTITSATLKLWYVNDNGNRVLSFYRMKQSWDETVTWNSIGGGIKSSNADMNSRVNAFPGSSDPVTIEIDVTAIVQGWINGDYANYGWGLINGSTNGLEFAAIENSTGTGAHTPILQINYDSVSDEPGIAMKNKVDYGGKHAIIDSYNSSQGNYGKGNTSSNALVTVNAIGSNKITLYSKAKIYGDAYIGPGGDIATGIKEWSGSRIYGTKDTLDETFDMPTPSAPTGSPFDGSNEGDLKLSGKTKQTIDSNRHFENMLLWSKSEVTIDGDITILLDDDLELSDKAKIKIKSGSSLTLYVKGECNIGGTLNAYYDKDPSDMVIHMLGNNKKFNMYGKATVYALLNNPNGKIENWNKRYFYGRMRGKELEGNGRIRIDLDSTLGGSFGDSSQEWSFGGTTQGTGGSGEVSP